VRVISVSGSSFSLGWASCRFLHCIYAVASSTLRFHTGKLRYFLSLITLPM